MKKDKRFPLIAKCIYENRKGEYTVCFTGEMSGVVVEAQDTLREVGYYAENFMPCWNVDIWTIIAKPSEYPKEMYVGLNYGNEKDALRNKNKRTIVFHHEGTGYIDTEGDCWKYAVDIPEQSNENQEVLLKIEELQEQLNELKSKL